MFSIRQSSRQAPKSNFIMNDKKRNLTLNLPPSTTNLGDQKNFDLHTPDILRIFNGGNSVLTPTANAILEKKMKSEYSSRTYEPIVEFDVDTNARNGSQSDFKSITTMSDGPINNDTSYPYSSAPLPLVDLMMSVDSEEMNTVSSMDSSPRLSPIDMKCQEVAKLELKRKRNREAASRCRKRKLENISKLEDDVKDLKEQNHDLSQMLIKLKEEYGSLQQKFFKHRQNGCLLPSM